LTAWSPILLPESKTAARARDAIKAITQAVTDYELSAPEKRRELSYQAALLYGYLAVIHNDLEWADRAVESLNLAIDQAAQQPGSLGLFGGLTGLGWTVEHLSALLRQVTAPADDEQASDLEASEIEEEEDLNADIDALTLGSLKRTSIYDLISGLVGFGIYFLERWPKPTAVQGIRAVFDRLENLAEHTNQGITWLTGTEFLPDWQIKQAPKGYYNLGVAHGIPGIIHFLAQISTTTAVEPERSHRLLEGAVTWVIAQQRPWGARSRFPAWVVPGEEPSDSRLAWCYGDLGILAVLLQAARRAGRKDWQAFAHDLLDHCLAWPPDDGDVGDAPLCHGAAGVAHIFNRIYQSEGDPRCRDAAVFWLERALAMRKPETGVGGFSALTRPDPEGPVIWEANPAFLDGSIGIALALLAALSPVEPNWDRQLLLSEKHLQDDSK